MKSKIILSIIYCILSIYSFAQFNLPIELTEELGGVFQIDSLDVDQDGDLDILATNPCQIFWYKNNGGVFEIPQNILSSSSDCQIIQTIAGDTDGDGDLDITYMKKHSPNRFKIFNIENLGGGNYGSATVITSAYESTSGNVSFYYQLGDIDNDGNLDILEAHQTGWPANLRLLNWAKGNGNGTFLPFQLITDSAAAQFKLFDFDLDGKLDVFYMNTTNLMYQRNLGMAQFAAMDTISLIDVNLLDIVDLNGDNYLDLIVTNYPNAQSLHRVINNAGNFLPPVSIPVTYDGYLRVTHLDIDDDGDQDVICYFDGDSYQFGTSAIGWHENNGTGSLSNFQLIDGYAMGIVDMTIGDFTGNGKVDLAIVKGLSTYSNDQAIGFYPNTPAGIQTPYIPISEQADNVQSIIESDVDSDGLKDIIVTSTVDKTVSWHKNLGDNAWGPIEIISEYATTAYNNGSRSSIAIDLDNDGDEDIITSSYWDSYLAYYENLGGGNFSNEIILNGSLANILKLIKADLDNDGFEDVIISLAGLNAGVLWLKNNGTGSLVNPTYIANAYSKPIVADLDQDGNLDIIGIGSGTIEWSRNLGGGSFSTQATLTTYTLTYGNSIAVADMNNDGELDLVIGSKQSWINLNRITVAYNTGGATSFVSDIVNTFSWFTPNSICVEDFDLDGDNDIFNMSYIGQATYLENLGNGEFTYSSIPASMRSNSIVTEAIDYDNDGDLDIFNGNSSSGISVLENLTVSPFKASGKIYFDLNQNGIFDASDIGTDQFEISSTYPSAVTGVNSYGDYHVVYHDSAFGTYESEPVLTPNWGISSAAQSYQQVINSGYVNQTNNDFGIYPSNYVNDVEVELTGGFPGCSDVMNLWVISSNKGTTLPLNNYELTLANGFNYLNSSFTPDSIVGQTVYWHLDSLFYFADTMFTLDIATPGSVSAGNTMTSTLTTYISDATGAANQIASDSLTQILTCNLTDTYKTGIPRGQGTDGYIDPSTSSIEYLILFQNTTPTTAEFLSLRDVLDTNLVWSSLEVISSSHEMTNMYFASSGQGVFFEFDNIQLPSVNADYLASKGYVKFRIDIKPNRPFPTVITNRSYPTFDLTQLPYSNTTKHTMYDCNSMIQTASILTESCIDGVISGSIDDNVTSSDFTWTIPSIYTELGSSFNWNSDTSGVFPVNLNLSNDYCSADTNFVITIHPNYAPPSDSLAICIGDSVQIFGQYTSTPGIYYNSLQSIYGCDSIVSKELFEFPLPNVSFYSLITLTCVDYAPIPLTNASPPNGQFVGPGIVGNTFDPSIAGVGVHTLFYHYTSSAGCSSSDSIQIVVDGCAETPEISDDSNLLTTYSPDNKEITLSITETIERNYSFGIYDMNGKLILEDHLNSNIPKKIDAQAFESGVYYVLLKESGIGSNYHFRKIYLY